jgi:hypothetical protein
MMRAFHVNAAGKFPVQAGSSQRTLIVAVKGGILKRFFAFGGERHKAIDKVGADAANLRPPGEGLGFEWM